MIRVVKKASTPPASSPAVRDRMSTQATRDTGPEMALRRELHGRGLRYRVNRRPDPTVRCTADIVFSRAKVAVFVDGCFWHRCPEHGTLPKANAQWWVAKLEGNAERDRRTDAELTRRGWLVLRFWEHTPTETAADEVESALSRRAHEYTAT